MRIDLNSGAQPLSESDRSGHPSASAGKGPSALNPLAEDQAQLSEAHVQVRALSAQVMRMPEIRQERVNLLRQVVLDGIYQPGSKQVAGALFDHMAVPAA